MKPKSIGQSIIAILFVCLTVHTGCSDRSNDAQQKDSQRAEADKQSQAELTAVVCTIGVADKTLCVLPWEKTSIEIGDAALLRRDAPRNFIWEESTQLASQTNVITVMQLMQGRPLDADCQRLIDLEGELTRLHIERVRGRDVVRKLVVLGAFDRDTTPLRVGAKTVEVVGGPVKCNTHKRVPPPSPAQ